MKRVVGIGCVIVFLLGMLWLEAQGVSSIAHASDPTLDAAIYQATVRAGATAQAVQQTISARDQDAANARATAVAIENAQRSQNATATAQAQARDAEATRVAQQTRLYIDTQATVNARNATATASWLNGQATRISIEATDTANAALVAATATEVSAHTTATAVVDNRNATATVVAFGVAQTAQAQREGVATMGLIIGALIVCVALIVIAGRFDAQPSVPAQRHQGYAPVRVELVEDPASASSAPLPSTQPESPEHIVSAPTIILAQPNPDLPAIEVIPPGKGDASDRALAELLQSDVQSPNDHRDEVSHADAIADVQSSDPAQRANPVAA